LATLIDAYEAEHYPMEPPDPIEAMRFRMEQQGVTQKDARRADQHIGRNTEVFVPAPRHVDRQTLFAVQHFGNAGLCPSDRFRIRHGGLIVKPFL
jgi:hypothetical protein